MKLILQIALGVFLGTLASQFTMNSWHNHQENITKEAAEQLRAKQEKVRIKEGERIRALLLQGRQNNSHDSGKPPSGFVPDDIQGP